MTATITVFFLGGTISMIGAASAGTALARSASAGPASAGAVSRLGGAELVEAVPQLRELDVALDVRDFRQLPSSCIRFADITELLDRARAADADGVVVVQGTDTIEETAYLIDLLWDDDRPIVVTGAMRNPSLAGADGPANLLAAVQVAASARFRGLGAVVAFNDEIHAARHVRKMHSTSPATFGSPNTGPIGVLVERKPVLLMTPPARFVLPVPAHVDAPVALLVMSLDDDGALLAAVGANYGGLVIAGFGAGHVPCWLADQVAELATKMPVVLASRTQAGPVLSHTYGFPGSEADLLDRGLISAGLLDAYKARVLLRVLLSSGADRSEVTAAFARAGGVAESA